ncbi:MAG: hypothetical protein RJA31_1140 [Actinomycetota bacterium]
MSLIAGFFVPTPATAYTLNSADFNPSYIISDAQFFDENALTEAQIQAFLQAKIGTCSNTRCLNVYKQDTFTRAATQVNGISALCSQYVGAAAEPAARIIYKVQKACHISAKVILATLQKEQGLVTATAPSADKLKIAMGYGCPDTAPCDALYFGFYNQVYGAASQLKRYTDTNSSFWASKKVGTTVNIGYHPKSFASPPTCGKQSVYIGNKATHALYIYTPYVPNAASLGNLWGTGDSCSSYGNRNFWRNYNQWFNLKAELYSQVAALPAATKTALGTVSSETNCPDTTNNCIINYQTGVVSLGFMGTLQVSFGPIGTAYRNSGGPAGPLGAIIGTQETISAGGTGYRQRFTNGFIYQAPNGATFTLTTAMNDFYVAQGGPAGALGWPASAARCVTTKCDQLFDDGLVITNSSGQLSVVLGPIGETLYGAGGINAAWGLPTAARQAVTTTSFGNGFKQTFQNGVAFEKSGAAAVYVANALIPALTAVGHNAAGWPTGTTQSSGVNRYQAFTAGTLFGSTSHTTGILLPTAMTTVWAAAGGATSYLGFPTTAAASTTNAQSVSGSVVTFTGGAIISSPAGVFGQPAVIRTKYLAAGGPGGALGYPIAAPTLSGGVWTQRFAGGTLTTAAPVTRPTIQLGSRGADVRYLQTKLKLTADGIFGVKTKAAVIAFQKSKGLTADGIVGPKTWAALG